MQPLDRGLVENKVVLDSLHIESRSIVGYVYLSSLVSDLPWISLSPLSHIRTKTLSTIHLLQLLLRVVLLLELTQFSDIRVVF